MAEAATDNKENPVLFCGSMVRATIVGQKDQTRRLVKRLKIHPEFGKPIWDEAFVDNSLDPAVPCLKVPYRGNELMGETIQRHYPKWMPGDHLWVRETWACSGIWNGSTSGNRITYRADGAEESFPGHCIYHPETPLRWKPSIFMKREFCRIILEVVSVRAERIQDISEDDARAEGINSTSVWYPPDISGQQFAAEYKDRLPMATRKASFAWLWNSLHAKPKPAKTNPLTGRREMCRVAYPWAEYSSAKLIDAKFGTKWYGCKEYTIGNPWVFGYTFRVVNIAGRTA